MSESMEIANNDKGPEVSRPISLPIMDDAYYMARMMDGFRMADMILGRRKPITQCATPDLDPYDYQHENDWEDRAGV